MKYVIITYGVGTGMISLFHQNFIASGEII